MQVTQASTLLRRKSIPEGQLLINGRWRAAADGATMSTFDPTTEERITDVAKGSPADADEAVQAASRGTGENPVSHGRSA